MKDLINKKNYNKKENRNFHKLILFKNMFTRKIKVKSFFIISKTRNCKFKEKNMSVENFQQIEIFKNYSIF